MKKLLIIYLAVLVSCEDKDIELSSNPIDSNIIVEVREVLEVDTRRLTLFCKTEKEYSCYNFPILFEKQTSENSFAITFTSVDEQELCLTAFGPARTLLDLNTVPNGEYDLELNNVKLKNKGVLKITDTDFSLIFDQKEGIDFVRTNTKRVPDYTYWVTIGYHEESSSALIDEFEQKFKDAGAVFSNQVPGHYYYYEIDDKGEIIANIENSGYHFMKKFIFQFDGDESKLQDLITIDGKAHRESLSMGLSTYKGEEFYNWAD